MPNDLSKHWKKSALALAVATIAATQWDVATPRHSVSVEKVKLDSVSTITTNNKYIADNNIDQPEAEPCASDNYRATLQDKLVAYGAYRLGASGVFALLELDGQWPILRRAGENVLPGLKLTRVLDNAVEFNLDCWSIQGSTMAGTMFNPPLILAFNDDQIRSRALIATLYPEQIAADGSDIQEIQIITEKPNESSLGLTRAEFLQQYGVNPDGRSGVELTPDTPAAIEDPEWDEIHYLLQAGFIAGDGTPLK